MQKAIWIQSSAKGLKLVTDIVKKQLGDIQGNGLLNLFVRHTSCSLLIQERARGMANK